MKKILTLIAALIIISTIASFGVCAADYTYGDMTISVPDFLKNDAAWAADSGFAYAFSDADVNMELNVSVYENEEYSYEGLDEDNLNDYAQLLRERYETGDYSPLNSVVVTSYLTEEGVAGIRSDLVFEDEQYVFYWFATDDTCYDLNFYIYNSEYLTYLEQIIKTLVIGTPELTTESEVTTEAADETMPVLSDDDVESDGDGQVADDGNLSKIMMNPLPAVVFILALILLIVVLAVKKKKKSDKVTTVQKNDSDTGIYYDPNTGNYYKTISDNDGVTPGQPIGYIYYPVQGDNNQQNNNDSTQN